MRLRRYGRCRVSHGAAALAGSIFSFSAGPATSTVVVVVVCCASPADDAGAASAAVDDVDDQADQADAADEDDQIQGAKVEEDQEIKSL